jgi:hypothetical protein
MPRIEDRLLKSVIYLYKSNEHSETGAPGGSGFLVGEPCAIPEAVFLFAVTNAHVARSCPVIRTAGPVSKASEPLLEIGKELLCFVPMFEANDRVVRIAHDDHVAGGALLPPLVGPLIIDMMEVDVRQKRAATAGRECGHCATAVLPSGSLGRAVRVQS